jgi:hypothetical protein
VTVRLRLTALLAAFAVVAVGCQNDETPKPAFSGDLDRGNPTTTVSEAQQISTDAPTPEPLSPERQARLEAALAAIPADCEILSDKNCLLPFPSDFHTRPDSTTGTQLRIDLPAGQLPNVDGVTLDPTEWNRNDGWSPSTPILAFVPGLDPTKTALPSEGDIEFSTTSESATVIVDLTSGQLVPHWAEMDSRAQNPDERLLILRPAQSLTETHQFAVAFRNLIGTDGAPLAAPITFQAIRDNNDTGDPRIEERQREFNIAFPKMAAAGVAREGLYLAWTFTVASPESLAGRMLSMRDDAFGKIAGTAPEFDIVEVDTSDVEQGIGRIVRGTFEVPLYLDDGGAPGSRMTYSPLNGQPIATGTYTANFVCVLPEEGLENGEAIPVVYGHGLLGSAEEVTSTQVQHTAATNNAVYCGTDMIGMSREDVGNAGAALSDINQFPSIPDRLQQGMLNTLFLARLLMSAEGLGGTEEFQTTSGANMLNNDETYYDGNSQGAIVGGAVTAVSTEWTKAVLGVGGMNYSTLLNRSVDFDEYFAVMRANYPDPLQQQIIFGVLQMLWDRGETSGYVQHLTDRAYDRTPRHQVLMTVAFGDHQVAPITADNIARTLNIPIYRPTLPDDVQPMLGVTTPQVDFFYDLGPIRRFPLEGSALYYWYDGTLPPPLGNITPTMSTAYQEQCQGAAAESDVKCEDPHEMPRRQPQVIAQKKAFFHPDGVITNVCKDEPCIGKPRSEFDY